MEISCSRFGVTLILDPYPFRLGREPLRIFNGEQKIENSTKSKSFALKYSKSMAICFSEKIKGAMCTFNECRLGVADLFWGCPGVYRSRREGRWSGISIGVSANKNWESASKSIQLKNLKKDWNNCTRKSRSIYARRKTYFRWDHRLRCSIIYFTHVQSNFANLR